MRVDLEVNESTGEKVKLLHNGDGTGTRTVYDADGNVLSVESVEGLPVDAPVASAADLAAQARTAVAGLSSTAATRKAVEALAAAVEAAG